MGLKCSLDKKIKNNLNLTVEFLKIIAEENRLKILCILDVRETCVCNIWKELELSQNLTSHHLKILKDFGLIKARKDGWKVFYSLDRRKMDKNTKLLTNFLKKYGECK